MAGTIYQANRARNLMYPLGRGLQGNGFMDRLGLFKNMRKIPGVASHMKKGVTDFLLNMSKFKKGLGMNLGRGDYESVKRRNQGRAHLRNSRGEGWASDMMKSGADSAMRSLPGFNQIHGTLSSFLPTLDSDDEAELFHWKGKGGSMNVTTESGLGALVSKNLLNLDKTNKREISSIPHNNRLERATLINKLNEDKMLTPLQQRFMGNGLFNSSGLQITGGKQHAPVDFQKIMRLLGEKKQLKHRGSGVYEKYVGGDFGNMFTAAFTDPIGTLDKLFNEDKYRSQYQARQKAQKDAEENYKNSMFDEFDSRLKERTKQQDKRKVAEMLDGAEDRNEKIMNEAKRKRKIAEKIGMPIEEYDPAAAFQLKDPYGRKMKGGYLPNYYDPIPYQFAQNGFNSGSTRADYMQGAGLQLEGGDYNDFEGGKLPNFVKYLKKGFSKAKNFIKDIAGSNDIMGHLAKKGNNFWEDTKHALKNPKYSRMFNDFFMTGHGIKHCMPKEKKKYLGEGLSDVWGKFTKFLKGIVHKEDLVKYGKKFGTAALDKIGKFAGPELSKWFKSAIKSNSKNPLVGFAADKMSDALGPKLSQMGTSKVKKLFFDQLHKAAGAHEDEEGDVWYDAEDGGRLRKLWIQKKKGAPREKLWAQLRAPRRHRGGMLINNDIWGAKEQVPFDDGDPMGDGFDLSKGRLNARGIHLGRGLRDKIHHLKKYNEYLKSVI